MSEERILQAIERIEGRINELDKNLNNKIDTISKDLKEFKTETDTRLDKFEEETRTNFVSMSQRIRNTNERITDLDKKMEKGFENVYKAVGTAMNSMMESIDQNYVKIKDIS